MNRPATATPIAVELRECADTVASYGPEYRDIAHSLVRIAEGQSTGQEPSDHFAFIGGLDDRQHLLGLITLTLQRLTDTAGLRGLPQARLDAIRHYVDCCTYLLAEAAGAADVDCPHPTDKEN